MSPLSPPSASPLTPSRRIGAVLGYAVMPYYERKYAIAFAANGNKPVPEERSVFPSLAPLPL